MLRVHAQRGEGDCSIACLAMLLNVSYEDALQAMTNVAHNAHRRGAWEKQIVAGALKLGTTLVKRKLVAMEHSTGVLCVTVAGDDDRRVKHVVVLRWGLLFDPDGGTVWEPETYIATKQAKVGNLLTREG
jgi:ABC-type bacteriocin/lantibiotic exporter with double-glycine peptidase domain